MLFNKSYVQISQKLKISMDFHQALNGLKNRCLLMFVLIWLNVPVFAVNKETKVSLTNENRILSAPVELHLTSADAPLVNSSVSLNNVDAWLFFDNIRPSEVIAGFLSNIFVDGKALSPGINGRISIYRNGAVVIPLGNSFKPLTVYTSENFSGDSIQLEVSTYHNNLGNFDNSIRSFKLKRGYMATFANSADGTGYSRVFIAADEDLHINLPDFLLKKVSFIRVFKYEWVSKKGKAGWNPNDINATSYYDWNIGGNSSEDVEYVAIRQNGGWPSWDAINSKQKITHLLGFNEPDRPDQSNMQFHDMISQWPEMMKSGLRIGSPAWSNPWGGNGGNLFDFIKKCDELNYRVDFVALHCYWGGKSPQNWYNDLKYIHEQTGRPLWITEWNNGANWTTEWWPDASHAYTDANAQKQLNDIKGILQVLDTANFVERYFIYDWVQDCRAMVLNGKLTKAGTFYNDNKSAIAYNSEKEVIPLWNYSYPELEYRYFSLRNSIRLSWTNANGEMIEKYVVEKKIDNGGYKTIYSGNDITQMFYLDPLDSADAGFITCRMLLVTPRGDHLKSNEVSWQQLTGESEIQSGNLSVNNLSSNTTFFSKRYSAKPLVILGTPGFNNAVPLTQRVNNISTSSFTFFVKPWSNANLPQLTETDELATIAMPAGNYDFGGLAAETQVVDAVSRNWVKVTFAKHFETTPVVFVTLASGVNSYPLAVAVRNVSTSGFEVCLKSEVANTSVLLDEKVNYLAIETGSGLIDGKRINVGRNPAGAGIAATPFGIAFDPTYKEPVLFAGLLSANNDFASNLRFTDTGNSGFEIIRQSENQGGVLETKTDDLGWLVMDLASNQPGTGTGVKELNIFNELKFYPNPAENTLYFHFKSPTMVRIFDLTGRVVFEATVENTMDIKSIKPGTYILKTTDYLPGKFIKVR